MRNLDTINPEIAKPQNMLLMGGILTTITGVVGISFAHLAINPFMQNTLTIFGYSVLLSGVLLALISRILKWGWETHYFGVSIFPLLGLAILGWMPMFNLIFNDKFPLIISLGFLAFNLVLALWWSYCYVQLYRKAYSNKRLWQRIYVEEDDAVYYLREGDSRLLEKLKQTLFPSDSVTLALVGFPFCIALSLVLFAYWFPSINGEIYITLLSAPLCSICLGMIVKAYLIYFYYPWKIKRATGKNVYIDMASDDGLPPIEGITFNEENVDGAAKE